MLRKCLVCGQAQARPTFFVCFYFLIFFSLTEKSAILFICVQAKKNRLLYRFSFYHYLFLFNFHIYFFHTYLCPLFPPINEMERTFLNISRLLWICFIILSNNQTTENAKELKIIVSISKLIKKIY